MKKLGLAGMIVAALIFAALGVTNLSAKCGEGKCGGKKIAMMKPDTGEYENDETNRYTKDKNSTKNKVKENGDSKCGAGKCGGEMKKPKKTMKCGAGKCG